MIEFYVIESIHLSVRLKAGIHQHRRHSAAGWAPRTPVEKMMVINDTLIVIILFMDNLSYYMIVELFLSITL